VELVRTVFRVSRRSSSERNLSLSALERPVNETFLHECFVLTDDGSSKPRFSLSFLIIEVKLWLFFLKKRKS
jgi:hypothetical protein